MLSHKQKFLIGGGCAAMIAVATATLVFTSSPKTQFLWRLQQASQAKRLTQDYDLQVGVNKQALDRTPLDTLSVTGQISTDDKTSDMTAKISGLEDLGYAIPKLHFVMNQDKLYLNTNAIYGYLARLGLNETRPDSEFVELGDLLRLVNSNKTLQQSGLTSSHSEKLQKEVSKAVGDYLKTIRSTAFTKDKDMVRMKLTKHEIKGLVLTIVKTLNKSNYYDGDKDQLKELAKRLPRDFDRVLDNVSDRIDMTISFGKKVGDAHIKAVYKVDTWSGHLDLNTKQRAYKAPVVPKNVVSATHLRDVITKAMSKTYETSNNKLDH